MGLESSIEKETAGREGRWAGTELLAFVTGENSVC